jgi:hypothetical protein
MIITWKDIEDGIDNLSRSLRGIHIDYIYGVIRGGTIPAVMLSHKLNIPIISYLNEHIQDKILIVDEICDSGKTFKDLSNNKNYIFLSLYKRFNSNFNPNYYYKEILSKEWLIFPWELK